MLRSMICILAIIGTVSCDIENNLFPPETSQGIQNAKPLENVYVIDEFLHPTMPPAEVLVVIDKSCSMIDERVTWLNNLPDFVRILENNYIDYRLGVISADGGLSPTAGILSNINGKFYASHADIDPVATFTLLDAVARGYNEQGLDAVYAALTTHRESANSGFFRIRSQLHIITISDESDQSINAGPRKLEKTLRRYSNKNNSIVSYSAIVNTRGGENCADDIFIGSGYIRMVGFHNKGYLINICDDDWSQPIQSIADMIGQNVEYEYFLKSIPVEETIEVLATEYGVVFVFKKESDLEGNEMLLRDFVASYTYNKSRNSIIFTEFIPEYNTKVTVSYYTKTIYEE